MTEPKRILLAQIATAHGIKGLVKLRYFGEDIADFAAYNPLYTSEDGENTLTLHVKNAVKGGYVAAIDGITDRTTAETYRGLKLYIAPDALPDTDEGVYYHADIIGCAVFEEDKKIGRVIALENFGAGDLLEIKPDNGAAFYLPFKDEFVPHVDVPEKRLDVIIPEGLI